MTPVQAHDPHYAADLHTSPALILQLEFAEIADLEQALRPHGYLQALAHDDLLPSLHGAIASHHAMLTRRYPVAEPADESANELLSYMVEYAGPAKDENAWHLFYVTGPSAAAREIPRHPQDRDLHAGNRHFRAAVRGPAHDAAQQDRVG